MNSNPRNPRARFIARIVVPAAILGVAAVLLVHASWRALERVPGVRVTPVAVIASASTAAHATDGVQAPGWIEPSPFATEVRALREGVVAKVHALEGETVPEGALLATLEQGAETVALAEAEAKVRLAEADLLVRRAAGDAAARALELTLEADRAVRDAESALAEAEAMEARLAAEIREAEATEAETRDEHERKVKLVESGSVSAGEARRLGLRVAALAARSESLRSERPAREARAAAARGNLESARTARKELIAERRAVAEATAASEAASAARDAAAAAREAARLALSRSEIRAPEAGTILRRIAAPGARVGGDSDALFALYDPARLQVRCDVPLKESGRIAVGLDAEIRVDAMPDRVFHGKVVRIVPQGDIQKNTVQCKVAIESPDPGIRPEMLARVRILVGLRTSGAEALAVPLDSLRGREGSRATVLVAFPSEGEARTAVRAITLGAERANGWIEVLEGLAAGDRIVLDPSVADGERIDPIESPKGDAP